MNYLISVITELKPKQIVSLTDNSPEFYKISKYFHPKGIKLIALQIATRTYLNGIKIHDLFIPKYLTIGKAEQFYYRKNLNNILDMKPIGSINAARAKEYLNNLDLRTDEKFDICLISEPHFNRLEHYGVFGIEKNLV